MTTVAETIITALADHGVRQMWGVVGDALNPITEAMRSDGRIEWIGVRHEEAGAFAASAQAQLTNDLAVCMGTVGPGAIHLLNGLYDAKKSHAPVLAIVGQVPSMDIGSHYFQEVDNDQLFSDVAVYTHTITSPEQMPGVLEQAVNAAISHKGVAVLTVPGDMGDSTCRRAAARRVSPPFRASGPPVVPRSPRRCSCSRPRRSPPCWWAAVRAPTGTPCCSWPGACRRRWCSP